MSVLDKAPESVPAARAPHVHEWELRAVEYDSWGQVSFYECTGCPGVRYA